MHTYTLAGVIYRTQLRHHKKITLMVTAPTASVGYQSKKMIYNKKPFELSGFANNQWAGPPAEMLQPLIVQCLRNTGFFHAVVSSAISSDRNVRLKVNLLELRQDFTESPSRIHMALQAELINDKTNKVMNSKVFATTVAAQHETPYGGVFAANNATNRILNQLSRFSVDTVLHRKPMPDIPRPY